MKDVMTKDHSMRSSKVIGMTVYNEAGDKIGTVFDILVRAGAEPTALIDVGDYVGAKKIVAFPIANLRFDGAKPMMMGASRDSLHAMPNFAGEWGSG
jgi:uncharacterized protein YrrD